jgi:hypothetical protein
MITSFTSSAQVNNIYIGPEGGPGLGVLWGSSDAKQDRVPIAAGTAGYAFQYNFTKIISIRTDLAYERAGTDYAWWLQINQTGPPSKVRVKDQFDYMTVPILTRATFGERIGFFVDAGPYFGALMAMREIWLQPDLPKSVTNYVSFFKRFDIGITEGLGVMVPLGTMFAVSFEARNNTGFYKLDKNPIYGYPNPTPYYVKTNTTNFIFAFIYKLVTRKPAAKQKS